MPIVPARCTNCNGNLHVDSDLTTFKCPYCHTLFITETAIQHYHVHISDGQSVDGLVKSGDTFITMNDYVSAKKIFTKLSEEYSYDYRGWFGLIKIATKNFAKNDLSFQELLDVKNLYQRASIVANKQERAMIDVIYQPYITNVENLIHSKKAALKKKVAKLDKQYKEEKETLKQEIDFLESSKNKKNFVPFIISLPLIALTVILSIKLALPEGEMHFIVALLILGFFAYSMGLIINSFFEEARNRKILLLDEQIKEKQNELNNCIEVYTSKSALLQQRLRDLGVSE